MHPMVGVVVDKMFRSLSSLRLNILFTLHEKF